MDKLSDAIKISVIGGSRIDTAIYKLAYEVGKEIAKNSAILICGGLSGTMEAACKGAKEEDGLTIGILPSDNENDANKYIDIKIPTGLGYARNSLVVLSSHAVIAINGSYGTLSEIGYALTYEKPLVALRTWELKPYHTKNSPDIFHAKDAREAVWIAIEKAYEYKKKATSS